MKLPIAVLVLTAVAGTASAQVDARWEQREVDLRYYGFTTKYSCEGFEAKVRDMLRAIGARDDLRVDTFGCGQPGKPEPFVNAHLKFSVPVEVGAGGGGEIKARWQTVSIDGTGTRRVDRGDCELVEHFRDQVLPALNYRAEKQSLGCVPHQLTTTPRLQLNALVPEAAS
ncbi:MAG: hypothetical protein AB7Q97_16875 [Gammaproteobacteria bacterium]